jgi:FkbM family methyltransferase
VDHELIFDVGLHRGEDTAYYLDSGYRVVGIEADPGLIEQAAETFAAQLSTGSLVLVHCAISDRDGSAEFHLSKTSEWNSLNKAVAERRDPVDRIVTVPGRRLGDLFVTYGVPLYCKIDIEGHDAVCLSTLHASPELPAFISVETECVGAEERLTDDQALETLRQLKALGYDRFKLVDQWTLAVLEAPSSDTMTRLGPLRASARKRLCDRCGYDFRPGASGPFGDLLDGEWLDGDTAQEALLYYRQRYFEYPGVSGYGFWCDWQAMRHI